MTSLPAATTPPPARALADESGDAGWSAAAGQTQVPVWFEYLVVVAGTGVLSFGGMGLVLAMLGHYSAAAAISLGALGTVLGTWLARPRRDERAEPTRAGQAPAVGMCLVAVGVAAWNAIDASHHMAVDRDPGVYAVAGRWIAEHGSLVVPAGAPWLSVGANVDMWSAGMYPQPGGTVEFQFPHLVPSLLAEAHNIGGDALMFRTPALLGALALCAVYLVGCRLVRRPWLMLAAATGLAISMPELMVTRDTYSESATQVLVWSGIALLLRGWQTRRATVSLLAGLMIGATLMTRIDAVAYLLPLPLLGAVGWLATPREQQRTLLRPYAAVLLGATLPAIIGTLDVQRRAGTYYDDLRSQMIRLYVALGLSVIIALVVVILWPRLGRVRGWLTAQRGRLGLAAAWVVAIGLGAAWSLRPDGPRQTTTKPAAGMLERLENVPVQPNRTFGEQSMRWMSWYLGPAAVALAIAGLSILVVRAIRRGSAAAIVVLAMSGGLTALYLWAPNITPEQVWAMRRFVPASLPLFVIAAAVAADAGVSAVKTMVRSTAWTRIAVAAGATAMVTFPLGTTLPVANLQWQANYLPLVNRTCDIIGPHAAVLMPAGDYSTITLPQTLRTWCNVPVAPLRNSTNIDVRAVAARLHAQGRTVWVVGDSAASVSRVDPALTPSLVGTAVSSREPEKTLLRPPQEYTTSTLTLYAAKLSTSTA
jgi:hypothetical protein